MPRTLLVLALFAAAATPTLARAQPGDPAAMMAAQRTAMARLAMMDGVWRGAAWTILANGQRRGDKFAHYRKLQSLREYILVAQDRVRVEQYVRHGEHWMLSEISEPGGVLRIEALGCEIALRDIYDRVELGAAGSA